MTDEDRQLDHLDEAKEQLEEGCQLVDAGNGIDADRHLAIADVHAQIAQAEQLKRLCDLLDGNERAAAGLIGVSGHVTSGSP